MRFVGILADHEKGRIKIGRSLADFKLDLKNSNEYIDKIVSYLMNGKIVIAFLHYVYDGVGNPIAPLIFYTDGEWIWPSYLAHYYAQNYSDLIPDDFLAYMKRNNYIPPNVSDEVLLKAQRLYKEIYGR